MRRLVTALVLGGALPACQIVHRPAEPKPDTSKAETPKLEEPEPLPVKKVAEEIVVAAWAEPSKLPTVGGQAQILVRVQKRGGARFPGVEVRLSASGGTLYSGGKVLLTDEHGMTRDRLTAKRDARITLNAGGTRYSFQVPLAVPKPE